MSVKAKSKFPVGTTQHFVDMVYLEYGKEISEDVQYHVEKYGYQGGLEIWQIDLMIDELEESALMDSGYPFRPFVMGYFGGSIQSLEFHNV